jgi:hypothetical protein
MIRKNLLNGSKDPINIRQAYPIKKQEKRNKKQTGSYIFVNIPFIGHLIFININAIFIFHIIGF